MTPSRLLYSISLFMIGVCFFTGCSKVLSIQDNVPDSSSSDTVMGDKSCFFVDLNKVYYFIEKSHGLTKSAALQSCAVAPYRNPSGDTLMYIVNYPDNDGWQILSSDCRTPAVIAEGESGRFSIEDGSPAVQVWLEMTARDMEIVRAAEDKELNFSAEEIAANMSVWGKEPGSEPRVFPIGHWEEETFVYTEVVEMIDHMTPQWDQWQPYNVYCPQNSSDTTRRAPAGCVAIAAAEVLYYLHYQLGVPDTMVSDGFCIGNVENYYSYFGSPSSTTWADMNYLYQRYWLGEQANAEAIMIGHIGQVVQMNYTNESAASSMSRIRTLLFPQYGISCSQGSYDSAEVVSNLNNHLPIIVSASNLLIPIDDDIHCFVIDGFKKKRTVYRTHHYWVSDDPYNRIIPPGCESYDTYSYSSTYIQDIKINWGWWSQWVHNVNDGWYGLTANWAVDSDKDGDGIYETHYTYNYWVNMLYDLAIAEE